LTQAAARGERIIEGCTGLKAFHIDRDADQVALPRKASKAMKKLERQRGIHQPDTAVLVLPGRGLRRAMCS
jgi:hypothetical protein